MKKFEFTSEGVKALSQELYQLNDAALATETAALKNKFQEWMAAHFLLSAEQLIYLERLDPDVQAFISVNSSFAIKNRLPVTLLKPAATSAVAKDSKITKPETKLHAEISSDGSYLASGEFLVEVSY